ncbi:MAG TPA: hypothetical protein VNX21_08995 [Candidatus Thermoplasmatota archaeon]|nr:hypothetical protein [Candidatus Thermoplasmatota archaeon]
MKAPLVAALLLLAVVPALPSASAVCTPPWSQWVVCASGDCVSVDGAAFHFDYCAPPVCTPGVTQFRVCVDWPCVIVDGPAIHREFCLSRVMA